MFMCGVAMFNCLQFEGKQVMSKQAEQDLENAIAQEQINNPDFFDDCKKHNQVSDLVLKN